METQERTCFWCDDTTPGHDHYTVMVYEDDRCLGRLTPDGTATRLKFYALVLSQDRAREIAKEINSGGVFGAKVRKF